MSIPEEASKSISSVADALRGNPSCLAAISLAAIFAVLTYLSLRDVQSEAHERELTLIRSCFAQKLDSQ